MPLLLVGSDGAPAGPDPDHHPAVWAATDAGIFKLDAADGEERARVAQPLGQGFDVVAVDATRGRVWAASDGTLQAFDIAGTIERVTDLERDGDKPGAPVALAVDERNGDVYLLENGRLLRIGGDGIVRAAVTFEPAHGDATALALVNDGEQVHAWVATRARVSAFTPDGREVATRTTRITINALAWDAAAGILYLANDLRVHRHRPGVGDESSIPFPLATALVPDGAGGIWIASRLLLAHAAVDATLSRFLLLPPRLQGPRHAATSDGAGGLWLAGAQRLRHVDATGHAGLQITLEGVVRDLAFYADRTPPQLTVLAPPSGIWTNDRHVEMHVAWHDDGIGADAATLAARITEPDGTPLALDCTPTAGEAHCRTAQPLADGHWPIDLTIADFAGNRSAPAAVDVNVDTQPPVVDLVHPADGLLTNTPVIIVHGTVDEPVTLQIDGTPVAIEEVANHTPPRFAFEHEHLLAEGDNVLLLVAEDRAGNQTALARALTLDTIPPPLPDDARIALQPNDDGTVTLTGGIGAVEADSSVVVTNTSTGVSVVAGANGQGAFTLTVAAGPGDSLSITARDAAGNMSEALTRALEADLPPDPADIATQPQAGVSNSMLQLESFLFEGPTPIQHDVDPAVFEERRFAVIRGRVSDADGEPLAGVTVSIRGHPQLGHTRTRDDGQYDLAVNGGGLLTLDFARSGRLPAQRQVQVPWGDYVYASVVTLIPPDDRVTVVDLTSNADMQVARGSIEADADGPRQATVLFPAGTTATITNTAGDAIELPQLSFRATEYSVGAQGPQRMPGELPPLSGYTYAVELSVDEALAAGAETVRFDQPVPLYVENFLAFPTGSGVPAGFYDRSQAAWVPADDGRVIEVLAVESGVAELDVTGAGPASDTELSALGITIAERAQLASLYAPGDSLWRVRLPHFSPWDLNWPFGPPEGAEDPPGPPDNDLGHPEIPDEDMAECDGCIINPENRSLAQEIPVTGTPFSLRYDSDRNAGLQRTVHIPVTGPSVHPELKRVDVTLTVAGQQIQRTFEPTPGQSWRFEWDGRDVRGRIPTEAVRVRVEVNHIYPMLYRTVGADALRAFGRPPAGIEVNDRGRFAFGETSKTARWTRTLTPGRPRVVRAAAIGGWTLTHHHAYLVGNVGPDVLQRGDGPTLDIAGTEPIIDTVAGTGVPGFNGEVGQATATQVSLATGVAVDATGNLYIADRGNNRIRRVGRDGMIETFAGHGGFSFSGDGGPAAVAGLRTPSDIAFGPDGALYIADSGNNRIRRVGTDGIISTVGGTGEHLSSGGSHGDDGPALEAILSNPIDVDVAADGSIYIVESFTHIVRRISPDGIVRTVAGVPGAAGFAGDGGPAIEARLNSPVSVALDHRGGFYIAERRNARLRFVGSDGRIRTVAANGNLERAINDGGPATEASFQPQSVAVGPDGTLFIGDATHKRIRVVDTNSTIQTLAGTDIRTVGGFAGDGGLAAEARLTTALSMALAPDGSLYFSDFHNHRIRRISSPGLQVGPRGLRAASRDGSELYDFDADGRHIETLDAHTGSALWSFTYDDGNRLIGIADADGSQTRIERAAGGAPAAIVSPDGQRTELRTDGSGRLVEVEDPAGAAWRMEYSESGLLTAFADRNGARSEFSYDIVGELVRDLDPAGGGWTLDRTVENGATESVMETAEGRVHRFRVEPFGDGGRRHITTTPDGLATVRLEQPKHGRTLIQRPDGAQLAVQIGPDPRFGLHSPVQTRRLLSTPAGRMLETRAEREAQLDASGDPFSLQQSTERMNIGGEIWIDHFDAASHMRSLTTPENRLTTLRVDAASRPLRVQAGDLAPWHFDRDARGRLTTATQGEASSARTTHFTYGDDGFLAKVTDPSGRSVQYAYDPVGRLTQQTLSDGRSITFEWDAEDNLRAITPPGREAHRFDYTLVGLDDSYTPPVLPGIDTVTHYRWNLDQQLTRIDRPDGASIMLDYDTGGRLAARATPRGTTTFDYHPITGQLVRVADTTGRAVRYDHDGPLLLAEHWDGDVTGTVSYDYDALFRMNALTVGGHTVSMQYDRDNLQTRAGDMDLHRDAATGLLTGTTLGVLTTRVVLNAFAEPERLSASHGDRLLFSVEHERDDVGRIVAKTEIVDGQVRQERYEYDERGQLHRVFRDGSVVTTYSYDANGNRLARNMTPATYDAHDRLLSWGDASFRYTEAGELRERNDAFGTTTYDYDTLGNLRSVQLPDGRVIEHIIDPTNRRVGTKIDGALQWSLLYRDQLNPIARLNADGDIDQVYIYGSRTHVPDYFTDLADGTTYRLITDHLGSVRLVVDIDTGAVAQRLDYDEFGRVLVDSTPGFQPFGFAGGLYDATTGLVRFGARDYDPEIGRWTAKDPIGFWGNDSGLYTYAYNDPINHVDPTGNFGLLGAGVGAAIGGVSSFVGALVSGSSLGDAAVAGLIGTGTGAIAGALPGGTFLRAAMSGGGIGGASNAGSQLLVLGADPCRSVSQFNWGALAGSTVAGAVSGGLSAHAPGGPLGQAVTSLRTAVINATGGAVGAASWSRATHGSN